MRTIKFRGKRLDNGEWIYGYLWGNSSPTVERFHIADIKCDMFQVIPETVGQFTGLTDKNGKEIYGGHILSIPFEEDGNQYEQGGTYYKCAVVYFDNNYHGWYVEFADGDKLSIWEYDKVGVEIIGTIYDNPELLKGEK